MFSMVFTINKRNVMVLCDRFIENDLSITLCCENLSLIMNISKDDYDSFFVVNEFEALPNTRRMLTKTWFNLMKLIESEAS